MNSSQGVAAPWAAETALYAPPTLAQTKMMMMRLSGLTGGFTALAQQSFCAIAANYESETS